MNIYLILHNVYIIYMLHIIFTNIFYWNLIIVISVNFLYDFLSIFSKFESTFLILVTSLKKQRLQLFTLICLILAICMFNKLLFQY